MKRPRTIPGRGMRLGLRTGAEGIQMARMLPAPSPSPPPGLLLGGREPQTAGAGKPRPAPTRTAPEATVKASVDRIENTICITTVAAAAAATAARPPPGLRTPPLLLPPCQIGEL
uniref:Uncharacterized protein n=1 Tax=Anopheles atroparvus TaxID=41427 RepID=A0A182ISU1_ANOAO